MSVILPQSVQQGIQEALPVIPNNGNPGGAYNMAPSGDGQAAAAQVLAASQDPNAWLQPSPWMQVVGKIMDQWDDAMFKTLAETNNPQTQGNYNIGVNAQGFTYSPVNDFGEPATFTQEGMPSTLPIINDVQHQEQYVPLP